MKTRPILQQLALVVMLLAGPSEEFFFQYPKQAIQDFFQSLKAKTQPPKANIQHYHVHYYPVPYPMLAWSKVPIKRDLEKLYDNSLASFGWPDYRYNYLQHPPIIATDLHQLLDAEIPISDNTLPTIDRSSHGLLLQIPVNQQFIVNLLKRSQQRPLAKATT